MDTLHHLRLPPLGGTMRRLIAIFFVVPLVGCAYAIAPGNFSPLDSRSRVSVINLTAADCLTIEDVNTTFLTLTQGQGLTFAVSSFNPSGESRIFTARGFTEHVIQEIPDKKHPDKEPKRVVRCSGSLIGVARQQVYVNGSASASGYTFQWDVRYLESIPARVVDRPIGN